MVLYWRRSFNMNRKKITVLCNRTNIVLQVNYTLKPNKQTYKVIEKKIVFVLTRGRG